MQGPEIQYVTEGCIGHLPFALVILEVVVQVKLLESPGGLDVGVVG